MCIRPSIRIHPPMHPSTYPFTPPSFLSSPYLSTQPFIHLTHKPSLPSREFHHRRCAIALSPDGRRASPSCKWSVHLRAVVTTREHRPNSLLSQKLVRVLGRNLLLTDRRVRSSSYCSFCVWKGKANIESRWRPTRWTRLKRRCRR